MPTRHAIAYGDKTFVNQTASRALDTSYTNGDSYHSMLVIVTLRCAITLAGGVAKTVAKSDGSTPPTTAVSGSVGIEAGLLGEDNTFQLSFVVKPVDIYKLVTTQTNGTVTVEFWGEMLF